MPFPVENKKEYFTKPADLKPGDGTTITDDGHIFGYLAEWNARLIGSGKKNTRPPRSRSGYSYANAFNYKCEDGSIVKVGVLAGKGGHHFKGTFQACQEAYANIENKAASVVYGEDEHGVWFSGAMAPDQTDLTAQAMRSSGVSGHWERPQPGKPLELLGSCCVNIPGFAQAGHRIVASAAMTETGGLVLTPQVEGEEEARAKAGQEKFSIMGAGSRITASAGALLPVSGTLCALGTKTIDGRQVNNIQYDRLPLPIWNLDEQGSWGHMGAKICGRIDTITEVGALVEFTGVIDAGLEGAEGTEAVSQLGVLGISMDGAPADGSEILYEYDDDGWPSGVTFDEYKITGATLTSQPAFQETIGVQVGDAEIGEPTTEPLPAVGSDVPTEDTPVDDTTDEPVDTEESVAASAAPEITTIKLPIRRH